MTNTVNQNEGAGEVLHGMFISYKTLKLHVGMLLYNRHSSLELLIF